MPKPIFVVRWGLAVVAVAFWTGCYEPVPFVISRACSQASDCPDDSACTEGRCQSCPECSPGERCLKGLCLPLACGGVTCPEGQACLDNRCTAPSCVGVSCQSGTRCEAGQCVACAAVDACLGGADEDCDGKTGCEDSDCADRPCGAEGPCLFMLCRAGACQEVPKAEGAVCRAGAGTCDVEERCNGSSPVCPDDARVPPGTVCRDAAGPCDEPERCEAASPQCPGDALQAPGTSCRASLGPCDPEETCDGASADCPTDALSPATVECSPASECELAAHCSGSSAACPARQTAPADTVCRPSVGGCDPAERCDGVSAACPSDLWEVAGVECAAATGPCEQAASCVGTSPVCPAKVLLDSTEVCRPQNGACDVEDRCSGTSAACPDAVRASSFECSPGTGPCDPAEFCDGSTKACPADVRAGPSTVCSPAAGCRLEARCDGAAATCPLGAIAGPGTTCRVSQGACDPAESCDGSSADCPGDVRLGVLDECAPSTGPCELSAFCDGSSPTCPAKTLRDATFVCNPAAGACDVEERCSGTSAACPNDTVRDTSFECKASTGVCDPAEFCDGSAKTCPADVKLGNSTVCSAASGCRLESRCDGANGACPTPALAGPGAVCRLGAGPCEADAVCSGSSEVCPANVLKGPADSCRLSLGPCDPEEFCDGLSATCPGDVRKLATDVCDPASGPCETTAYCDGSSAVCPAKTFLGNSTICGPKSGDCDLEERCSGSSASCPVDDVQDAGFVCRASLGACDPQEICDGTSKACPVEVRLGPTDLCAAASGECENAAYCDGASATCPAKTFKTTTCRAATDLCDEPEACSGSSATCPNDLVSTTAKLCGPSLYCDGTNKTCPSGAPAAPVFVSIAPASPNNTSTTPVVKGTSSADTVTVRLYSDATCTTQIGSGTKAQWEGAGITVTVAANQSTVLFAKASNGVPLDSVCAEMTTYVHDNLGPTPPVFTATVPATPTGPSFTVQGTSSADTATVTVYQDAGCATPVGTGPKAVWEGAGVAVTISPNVTTPLYGKAFDALGNGSTCVLLTNYTAVHGWTWVAGPSTATTVGVAANKGVADPTYYPGGREKHTLMARSGQLWTFGGYGCTTTNCSIGYLNDLWRFDGTSWAWMAGAAGSTNNNGVYGTKGIAAAANTPGSRGVSASAVDAAGNLWVFGGWGYGASTNKTGELNDLWKYDVASGMWTWISGRTCSSGNCKNQNADDVEPLGVYGTKGVAAAGNVPGGRDSGIAWFDSAGRFWLFGGTGCDAASCVTNANALNDVWRFDPASGLWTWVAGSSTANSNASYGTKGVTVPGNVPGPRYLLGGWYTATGGLSLFGGYGYDSTATKSELGDLWRFDGSNFTWTGGPSVGDQTGLPGAKGTAAPGNWPGTRDSFALASGSTGPAFLYGGNGCHATACSTSMSSFLGALWTWDGTSWTWLTGSTTVYNEPAVYGTRGVLDVANSPGGRARVPGVVDSSGAFWLFGGDSSAGKLSDLWRYQ